MKQIGYSLFYVKTNFNRIIIIEINYKPIVNYNP